MAVPRNKKIKWINKFRREEGFVKSLSKAKGYFQNTFDFDEARLFSDKEAQAALSTLEAIGEAENNEFAIVCA